MKISLKIPKRERQYIYIHTPFIRLDAALKLSNIVGSGGMAKEIILAKAVKVNHAICIQRGRKLRDGDTFEFEGMLYEVKNESQDSDS